MTTTPVPTTTETDEASKAVVAEEVVVPKVEDTAPPVVATEALAAAAAAAVNATVDEAPAVGLASPPPPQQQQQQGRVSLLSDVDGQGKRRFFPRVKHLIGNKEWEDFLTQVLQCIEEAGAPETAAASHKANNAWYKAFDLIYGGVAREYSIPTGKNRYHKFKDKILEVWVALEGQAPGENHCRDLAMEQYDRYKRACAEASKNGSNIANPGVKAHKMGAGQSASGAYKLAGGKRSYSTAMGGGASLPTSNAVLWKNLDEKKVLEGLPAKLQSLIHLKQLSKEMAAGTANRAARKGIEEHSKKLDGAYMEALTDYLKDVVEQVKTEETPDVEMTDGEAKAEETPAESKTDEGGETTEEEAYEKCLTVAFLYRYSSTVHEQKILADAYAKYTAKCVTFATTAEPAPVTTVEASTSTNTAEVAAAAAAAPEAAAPAVEETAAVATAQAMDDEFPSVSI